MEDREPKEFADPETLTPDQRIELINEYRRKVLEGETLEPEELRYAGALLRIERRESALGSATKRRKALKKEEPKPVDLSEFVDV